MTNLTFNKYQRKARETAVYPEEHAESYTVLGLLGEAGEIAQLAKRRLRDGLVLDRERLASEVGDCLWYFAMYLFERGCPMPENNYYMSSDFTDADFPRDVETLFFWIAEMLKSAEGLEEECAQEGVLAALNTLARHTPHTLEAIAQANLDKLADRAARGVLRGEGDEVRRHTEQAIEIVKNLADLVFDGDEQNAHESDCMWLRARQLVQELDDDAD